jgi:CHAD domain-containing protein
MMPGLAGFVVMGDEASWDDVLDEVVAALAGTFGVVPDGGGAASGSPSRAAGGARRRTWFDTFDWRLYRAGLFLEYVAAHRGGDLVLTGGSSASQQVPGWRAGRAYQAGELPDGPVTSQIASLIFPRALLPVVTVASTATVSRLLNADGKTVARLLIDRPVIAESALPPRVAVAEVRGYPGQARRAARIIALTPGVEPSPDAASGVLAPSGGRLLDDALLAIGRRSCDYSNKVNATITAGMPAAKAVAAIMRTLLDALQANVDGVLRDTDSEFLHDLRVAVRRTRAAIKLLGDCLGLSDADHDRFAAEFKWLGDLTTPVRDLDVHLLGFDALARQLRAAKSDDLAPFRAFLAERRTREFRILARGLRSERFGELMSQWRAALEEVSSRKAKRGEQAMAAGQLAVNRTARAFRKVSRNGAAITPDSPPESLHDLRKRCKELRYSLEFFAPLHDKAAYAAVVGDLKKLQDCLGDFQDTEVQIEEIRALATAMLDAGAVFGGSTVPAGTLLAMGELTAGLAESQREARAVFESKFAAFAGPDGKRRISVLLRRRT